jgi:hypothetical protein
MCAESASAGFAAHDMPRLIVPMRTRALIWLVRAAAAAVLLVGVGDLARVMWALPWPVDLMAALGLSAVWTASVDDDTSADRSCSRDSGA